MSVYTLRVRPWGSSSAYTDLTPYIAFQGLKWSRNDVEASTSGRGTQDGLMHRARVSIKIRLDVSCVPMTAESAQTVLQAIKPMWLQVQYYDPQEGSVQTKKMYSNNIPASFCILKGTTMYWMGIEFPLIEQ